ncbi:acyl-CoA N-acyltransferase [Podospora aff. communis PSN243]|uniref:Histone acetyltransferase type B catalytic subunit n=1 Tax=Podospora aff. communis PSN243 TaxID=3040156 RepID=A0AAV9G774_9PEZI|nr:acyl-CoA N-acyltransferase [Podospora aff. communis PSN243]
MSDTEGNEWSVNAKKAFTISLVRPTRLEARPIKGFRPAHLYSIFDEDEQIFGYEGLEINLDFNASDMRPNLRVKWRKQFEATGETEATDVTAVLRDYLPEVAFQKKKEFDAAIRETRADWTPPGELTATFTRDDVTYEVWKGSLADLAVKQLVKRIQIFVPMFIEGGTYINTDDPDADRWTVFFLYQKTPVPGEPERFSYVFTGYSTVYRFFLYQTPTPPASPSQTGLSSKLEDLVLDQQSFDLAELPCRTRISQFIVLPPFQQKGLGPKLYSVIFQEYLRHPQTVEITVEDPNEAFDDMRDIADLHFLRKQPEFNALHIDTSIVIPGRNGVAPSNVVDRAAAEAVRRKAKIAPRQFARVLEMHLMSKLPDPVRPGIDPNMPVSRPTKDQKHEYDLWHLMVKQRVYRQNKDALGELEIPERIIKLDETVSSVAFDFARLLLKAEKYKDDAESANRNGKRKADEDADDVPAKKQKV